MTIRVLYVDDEDDIREVASLALGLDPELELLSCASGGTALEAAAAWKPDLILLDMMMPGMDGRETFRRLTAQGHSGPIVFITARSQQAELEELKALGAAGVIAKPFDPMSLAAEARAFLGR